MFKRADFQSVWKSGTGEIIGWSVKLNINPLTTKNHIFTIVEFYENKINVNYYKHEANVNEKGIHHSL